METGIPELPFLPPHGPSFLFCFPSASHKHRTLMDLPTPPIWAA